MTAFALAFVLARAYPRYAVLFYGLAGLVAVSRVYLAKHFPSDVVAGAAIGLLAGWITCRFRFFPCAWAHLRRRYLRQPVPAVGFEKLL